MAGDFSQVSCALEIQCTSMERGRGGSELMLQSASFVGHLAKTVVSPPPPPRLLLSSLMQISCLKARIYRSTSSNSQQVRVTE